jgi:hypothetical protein
LLSDPMVAILGELQRAVRLGSVSFQQPFAIEGGLCYSLRVGQEQFCFPVAFGPAHSGNGRLDVMLVRRAGRGKSP